MRRQASAQPDRRRSAPKCACDCAPRSVGVARACRGPACERETRAADAVLLVVWNGPWFVPRPTVAALWLRCRLAGLAANLLTFVPNSLALVRLRLADGTHLGCELAD